MPPWSLLSSIDRLSISFFVCLKEGHRGGNRLCLVGLLGLTCALVILLSVADSPKMWLQCLLGYSCRPLIASRYYSLSAWRESVETVIDYAGSSLWVWRAPRSHLRWWRITPGCGYSAFLVTLVVHRPPFNIILCLLEREAQSR